jgi:hypothetical protein
MKDRKHARREGGDRGCEDVEHLMPSRWHGY